MDRTHPNIPRVAAAIASHLPEWELVKPRSEEYDHFAELRHKYGATVGIHYDRGKCRTTASARLPYEFTPYGTEAPKASFRATRPAAVLAKDLERRVLEPTIPLWADCERRRREAESVEAREEQVLARIANLIGDEHCSRSRHKDGLYVSRGEYDERGDAYLDGRIETRNSGERVEFKLTVSSKVAEKIARLLAKAGQ
jgi:hypothetical protein